MDNQPKIKTRTSFESFAGYPYNYWNLQDISNPLKKDNLLSVTVDKQSGKIANIFWRLPIPPQQQQNQQQTLQDNMQFMQTMINHKAQTRNPYAIQQKQSNMKFQNKPELGRTTAEETLSLITGLLKEEGENGKLDYKSYLLLPPFEGNNEDNMEENDPTTPTVDDLIRQRKKDAQHEAKPKQLIFMPYCGFGHAVVLAIDLNKYPEPNSIGCFDSSGYFNKLVFLNLNMQRFPRSIRSSINPHRLNHRRAQFFKGNCTYHAEAFIKTSMKYLQEHPEINSLEEFEKVVNNNKFRANVLAEKDSIEHAPQAIALNNGVMNGVPQSTSGTEYNVNRLQNRALQFNKDHKKQHHVPKQYQTSISSAKKLTSTVRPTSPIGTNDSQTQHDAMQSHDGKTKQQHSDKSKKKSLHEREYNQTKIIESNATSAIQKSSKSRNGSSAEPFKEKQNKSGKDLGII